MKNVTMILGLALLGAFLVKPTFLMNSANRSLTQSKLNVSTKVNSAFNDESLHAGIGGTWSAADKGGGTHKN